MSSRTQRYKSLIGIRNTNRFKLSRIEEINVDPLFCELSELTFDEENDELVWKQSARWLKFIEVLETSERWSKPHVSTMSTYALIQLKDLMDQGCVLLDDFHVTSLDQFVDFLTDSLSQTYNLNETDMENLIETLLLRHVHSSFHTSPNVDIPNINRKFSIVSVSKSDEMEDEAVGQQQTTKSEDETKQMFIKELVNRRKSIDLIDSNSKVNKLLKRKIPNDAKAANVLIGEVDFLENEIVAFVRFTSPLKLENFTEVPLLTKFLFILLGPVGRINKYREIGKCMGTLLSDEMFQNDCNHAEDKVDIVRALEDFYQTTVMLPPGQWDASLRLQPPSKLPTREERMKLRITKIKEDETDIQRREDDPCLSKPRRWFGGLINDIKRKSKWYLSDFKDGLNFQCIPAIPFLYFAFLSPILVLAGLLPNVTDNNMGTIEGLMGALISGVLYSLFAGQPISVVAYTGPILVFEGILNSIAKKYEFDYLGFRCWIGLWVFVFLMFIVVVNFTTLIKYITRFTEEAFALLISIIYIYESIRMLFYINQTHKYTNHPILYQNNLHSMVKDSQIIGDDIKQSANCEFCILKHYLAQNETQSINNSHNNYVNDNITFFMNRKECSKLGDDYVFVNSCNYTPDIFFFSIILYLGTIIIILVLKNFRLTNFFPTLVRVKLSNFGIIISISLMVLVDYLVGLDTPKLNIPSEFHPTIPSRGWLINPVQRLNGKWWLSLLAAFPALLATILIFMDQQITVLTINRKSNKLKKSGGYHLDLFIIALGILINSFLGLPWFVASTIISMNHMIALRKMGSSTGTPNVIQKFTGVIEQRVTGILVFILIGCSIFMTPALELIPMPVLYAIFLYMGVTPLGELEFFRRMLLIFVPKKYQPDLAFLRYVKLSRIHIFTLMQFACLSVLFVFRTVCSIAFPFMLLALVFIRFGINRLFTKNELSHLDDLVPDLENKIKYKNANAHQSVLDAKTMSQLRRKSFALEQRDSDPNETTP